MNPYLNPQAGKAGRHSGKLAVTKRMYSYDTLTQGAPSDKVDLIHWIWGCIWTSRFLCSSSTRIPQGARQSPDHLLFLWAAALYPSLSWREAHRFLWIVSYSGAQLTLSQLLSYKECEPQEYKPLHEWILCVYGLFSSLSTIAQGQAKKTPDSLPVWITHRWMLLKYYNFSSRLIANQDITRIWF